RNHQVGHGHRNGERRAHQTPPEGRARGPLGAARHGRHSSEEDRIPLVLYAGGGAIGHAAAHALELDGGGGKEGLNAGGRRPFSDTEAADAAHALLFHFAVPSQRTCLPMTGIALRNGVTCNLELRGTSQYLSARTVRKRPPIA